MISDASLTLVKEVYEKILQLEDEYMAQAGVVEKA